MNEEESVNKLLETFTIEIDSQYRNKHEYENPYNFTINYSDNIDTQRINPTSDAFPMKEWSWNSHPPVTVIQAPINTTQTTPDLFPFVHYTRDITNNINFSLNSISNYIIC